MWKITAGNHPRIMEEWKIGNLNDTDGDNHGNAAQIGNGVEEITEEVTDWNREEDEGQRESNAGRIGEDDLEGSEAQEEG